MSTAEALAELRQLALCFRAEGDQVLLAQVFQTVRDIADGGVDPVMVLRIRRFRRLAALKASRPGLV